MGQIGEFTPEQYDDSELEYTVLRKRFTLRQAKKIADDKGRIEAVVAISLNHIVNGDKEDFFDDLSASLVDSAMSDISYEMVGFEPEGILHIKVSGVVDDLVNGYYESVTSRHEQYVNTVVCE